jgi:hypothetical protein
MKLGNELQNFPEHRCVTHFDCRSLMNKSSRVRRNEDAMKPKVRNKSYISHPTSDIISSGPNRLKYF